MGETMHAALAPSYGCVRTRVRTEAGQQCALAVFMKFVTAAKRGKPVGGTDLVRPV
jgi:hypothetical protein